MKLITSGVLPTKYVNAKIEVLKSVVVIEMCNLTLGAMTPIPFVYAILSHNKQTNK